MEDWGVMKVIVTNPCARQSVLRHAQLRNLGAGGDPGTREPGNLGRGTLTFPHRKSCKRLLSFSFQLASITICVSTRDAV